MPAMPPKEKAIEGGTEATKEGMSNASLTRDPWQHRSERMTCMTCMWFLVKGSRLQATTGPMKGEQVGRCRRHSPSLDGFPVVFGADWCGDHKVDETK